MSPSACLWSGNNYKNVRLATTKQISSNIIGRLIVPFLINMNWEKKKRQPQSTPKN